MAKETIGYLPGNEPEAQKANLAYQEALLRMEEALNVRQNRMFDPQMLALAQGFLAPTQTGGFGESLGSAAKNIREAQQQEEKEEREIASARLGLAGRGIEVERLRQRDREFQRLMGDEPSTTLSSGQPSGPLSATGGKGPLSAPPPGFEGVQGIQVAPANPRFMTGRQYIGAARLDPSISPAAAVKDAQEIDRKRYEVREGGVQDLASGMYYAFPKGETVERQIFGQEGVFKVDARTAALLDMYAANGDPRYYEVADRVLKGPKAPPKPGEAKPEEDKGEPKIQTTAEVEGEKTRSTERAKAQEKDRADTIAAGSDAASRIGMYRQLEKIAGGPNAKAIFGIFERPDVFSNIMQLVETGVGTQGFSVGIPAVRTIMTNAGLPQNIIDQSQFALSLMANIQLQMSRLQQGQGAVSDYERSLFGMAAITAKDNPQTILAKLDLLRARAEFDREVAKAVRTYKGNIDDFKASDTYTNMIQRYEDKIGGIVENRLGSKPPERSPSGRDNRGAASRLPAGL